MGLNLNLHLITGQNGGNVNVVFRSSTSSPILVKASSHVIIQKIG